MRRHLPPLNAVKAFEAAGRNGSLSQAAAELGVTHGAISRQIKILEQWLGARLLVKSGRGISLTVQGREFLLDTIRILDELALASDRLAGSQRREILRINASQTFALRWLIPRLPRFTAAHPQIEIRLGASIDPIEKLVEQYDLAIRRGKIGETSVGFLSENCTPVASPALLQRQPVHDVKDLASHTLLHAESLASLWPTWLAHAGHPDLTGKAQLRFDPLYQSLQAAIDGAGIAMAPDALVAEDIKAGRLVALFTHLSMTMDDFHVYISPRCHSARHAKLFQRWLVTEGQGS